MQNAFEKAVARLFVRLGVPGTYRLADGREIATRFIAKQADVVESFGDTRLVEPDGSTRLDVIVEQMEARMARSISQGSGLAPTLERRYGLNPAAGAMR